MTLQFFYKNTVEDFSILHNSVYNHQSKASKDIFKSTLIRIEKLYKKKFNQLEMVYAKDVKTVYDKLTNETEYSENTKLQTISITSPDSCF